MLIISNGHQKTTQPLNVHFQTTIDLTDDTSKVKTTLLDTDEKRAEVTLPPLEPDLVSIRCSRLQLSQYLRMIQTADKIKAGETIKVKGVKGSIENVVIDGFKMEDLQKVAAEHAKSVLDIVNDMRAKNAEGERIKVGSYASCQGF
jgi:hypothetical protein